jgi:hypothetical protein
MKHTRLPVVSILLGLAVAVLAACGAEDAAKVSGVIVDGAKRLKSSGQTQLTVRYQPPDTKPYVIVVYPAVRTAEDEAELEKIAPRAMAISQAGAALSPKAEGFSDTLALWRLGSLATFTTSCRGVAEALMVVAVAKNKGGPTDVTLNREGDKIYIVGLN